MLAVSSVTVRKIEMEENCRKVQIQYKKKKVFPKERKMKTDAVSSSIMLARAWFLLKNRHSVCFELFVTGFFIFPCLILHFIHYSLCYTVYIVQK